MVSSERRSFSSSSGSTGAASSSSSSSGSATGVSVERFGGAADRMVKEELEAVEALADLAHLAMRESCGAESAGSWGLKGKRAKKRVKSESPPSQSGLNPVDPVPTCPDLRQDQAVTSLQQCEMVCTNVVTESVKTEQVLSNEIVKAEHDAEVTKLSPICTTSYPSFSCSKSRRNLTEEEREERRMRRILANRESARQTIRRRQDCSKETREEIEHQVSQRRQVGNMALCEELTRKSADLASENENLKKKKELALKEYQSLEKTNKHLKVRMAKVIKEEEGETPGKNMSAYVQMQISPSSPSNSPLFLFNRPPFTPVFWPSIIQLQHVSQNPMAIPSNIPLPTDGTADSSHEQECPLTNNGTRTPLYVFPCPLFIPHFDNGNGLQPQSLCLNNKQEETSFNNRYSASSSSRTVAQLDNHHCSFPIRLKAEASGSMKARLSNDLNETSAQFPLDGADQHTGPHPKGNGPKEVFLTPASVNHERVASSVKHESGFKSDHTATTEKSFHMFSALPEKNSEPVICPNRKLVDAIAAAEARKRRKKLTKLKNLHGWQCRAHC